MVSFVTFLVFAFLYSTITANIERFPHLAPEETAPKTPVSDDAVDAAKDSIVWVVSTDAGQGTGFAVDHNGGVITNAHVVGRQSVVFVGTDERNTLVADVVAADHHLDLAYIRIRPFWPHLQPKPIELRRQCLSKDDDWSAAIIGYPQDARVTLRGSMQYKVWHDGLDWIHTDMPIIGGHSGGPLIDGAGRVVGVVTRRDGDDHTGMATSVDDLTVWLHRVKGGVRGFDE